jgi:hypothetical protein
MEKFSWPCTFSDRNILGEVGTLIENLTGIMYTDRTALLKIHVFRVHCRKSAWVPSVLGNLIYHYCIPS